MSLISNYFIVSNNYFCKHNKRRHQYDKRLTSLVGDKTSRLLILVYNKIKKYTINIS